MAGWRPRRRGKPFQQPKRVERMQKGAEEIRFVLKLIAEKAVRKVEAIPPHRLPEALANLSVLCEQKFPSDVASRLKEKLGAAKNAYELGKPAEGNQIVIQIEEALFRLRMETRILDKEELARLAHEPHASLRLDVVKGQLNVFLRNWFGISPSEGEREPFVLWLYELANVLGTEANITKEKRHHLLRIQTKIAEAAKSIRRGEIDNAMVIIDRIIADKIE